MNIFELPPSPLEDLLPPDPVLTPVEIAFVARVDPRTVRFWATVDELHGTKIGKLWRFRRDDVVLFLRTRHKTGC
jgi:hypothetical protein